MKKLISVLCSLTMLAGCGVNTFIANAEEISTSTETSDVLIGDVNSDSKIDLMDATQILVDYLDILAYRYIGENEQKYLEIMSNTAEDVSNDGTINAYDCTVLLRYIAFKMVHPESTLTVPEHHYLDLYGTEKEQESVRLSSIDEYEKFDQSFDEYMKAN